MSAGETGAIVGDISLSMAMVISAMFAISVWSSLQTFIFIMRTFKMCRGLYFWSMVVADLGIPLRSICVLLRFFALAPNLAMCPLISIGFWMMVTGQSVVMYSRLNLIVGDPHKIRWTAVMIATTTVCLELPTSSFFIASNVQTSLNDQPQLVHIFNVLEIVQTAMLTTQEFIISALYVFEAARALKPMQLIKGAQVKNMLRELTVLCVLTLCLDISLIIVEYNGHFFALQTIYKGVIYSIKLQVEAFVLNNLTALVRTQHCSCHSTPADNFSSQLTRHAESPGTRRKDTQPGQSMNGQSGAQNLAIEEPPNGIYSGG